MARQMLFFMGLLFVLSAAVMAQGVEPGADREAPPGPGGAESAPAAEATQPIKGDVVVFKSGKKLSGVQILRLTPRTVDIEYLPGLPPLKVQRKLVDNIVYDDIDAKQLRRRGSVGASESAPEIIPGEELSPEFHRKLMASLSEEPIVFEATGFVKILNDLSARSGASLELTPEARQIPKEERNRDFTIKPGTSLYAFLREDFLKKYPALHVLYKFDKIVVTKKTAPEPQEEEG